MGIFVPPLRRGAPSAPRDPMQMAYLLYPKMVFREGAGVSDATAASGG